VTCIDNLSQATNLNYISPEAKIGCRVEIGIGARIYPWVEIGDDTSIGDYCIIGHPTAAAAGQTVIGAESTIRSHSVIYRDVHTGAQFQTGHHALVRDGMRAGINLRMGSFADIEGDCTIGDYCRFHGYSHIGRGSRIGSFVWIYSNTILLNDPLPPSHIERPVTLEDGAVVCATALVMPGAVLRKGSFICAGARASGEVPPGGVVDGPRGEVVSHVALMAHMETSTCHPWMRHFHDAYPPEAQERIRALGEQILEERRQFRSAKTDLRRSSS
jgi:UDP-3-O-[3-hydroxymyristoyl] glucosamine N-acyltransferase